MVAGKIRVLVVLVLVMGIAGPVAAGEEMAVEADAVVTALEAADAVGASGASWVGMGGEASAGVAPASPLREPEAAISERARMVSAGYYHTCALTVGGGVKCWGDNSYGQLGDGTTTNSTMPVDVVGLSSGVTAVDAGHSSTCALMTGGGVKCWGWNQYGQLGNGTTTSSTTPVDVVGLSGLVTTVSAGHYHTCVLTTGGDVKCWGYNSSGQLGNGTTTNSSTPVDVVGLSSGVTTISAGRNYTCAVTASGGAKCWGANWDGQLGNGTTGGISTSPVDVVNLSTGVTSISAGGWHTCALSGSGEVKCWGRNNTGQLGDGTTDSHDTPVSVVGLTSGVADVDLGDNHTCAIRADDGATCWGYNYEGQLGDSTTTSRSTPIDVMTLSSGVVTISATGSHTCAVTNGSGVKCWGENDVGQLGTGNTTNRSAPVDVIGLSNGVTAIDVGGNHSCDLTTGGGVECWGYNYYGQLGDGTTDSHSFPTSVAGLSSGAAVVSAGSTHTCAVAAGGGAKCWGNNESGRLGNGTTTNSTTPVDVTDLSSGVAAITAGATHTCALTNGGGVKCWGENYAGQLGDGTTASSSVPVNVLGLSSGVAAISAGGAHTCALTNDGGLKCWGYNGSGQLGNGTTTSSSTPTDVVGLSSAVAVSAGSSHTCALTTSSGAKCWGDNQSGQLGDGTSGYANNRSTPVDVIGLSDGVMDLSAGSHTCAVTSGGGVKCWGGNSFGELGTGTTTGSSIPVNVVGLSSGISAITAGGAHTCALTNGGGLKCWGSNQDGQLGVNPGWTPVDVLGLEGSVYTTIAKSGANGVLTWLHMVSAVDHYEVYRSTTTPYFEPGGPDAVKLSPEPLAPPETATEVTFTDTGVLGSPGSYFYAVVPVNDAGEFYATSNRTGALGYGMTPGSGLRRR